MGLSDFLSRIIGKKPAEAAPSSTSQPAGTKADLLFVEFVREATTSDLGWSLPPSAYASGRAILESPEEDQAAVLARAFELLIDRTSTIWTQGTTTNDWRFRARLKSMVGQLLRRNLPFDDSTLSAFLLAASRTQGIVWEVPWGAMIRVIESRSEAGGVSPALRPALQAARNRLHSTGGADTRKLIERMDALITGRKLEVSSEIIPGEAWADLALQELTTESPERNAAWERILDHAMRASGSAPSKKWLAAAAPLVAEAGSEDVAGRLGRWLEALPKPAEVQRRGATWRPESNLLFAERNAQILKGLAWLAATLDTAATARALGAAAEACFKKVPGYGPRNAKIANACVAALSIMTVPEAAAQLSRLKARVKHASSLNRVGKALGVAAERAGVTTDDLEESTVGTYELEAESKRTVAFGEHVAVIQITGPNDVEVQWSTKGKALKSVPAVVKKDFAEPYREFKRMAADLEKTLFTIRHRIERAPLDRKEWRFKEWRERYIDHPVASVSGRRLIWWVGAAAGLWRNGMVEDVEGKPVPAPDDSTPVRLWHPAEVEAEAVLAWRRRLEALEITQPFKQAHREVYLVTDAERRTDTYSNRFAAHILRQHQFAELCRQRGWRYRLQGGFDSANSPTLELPRWNLRAEYWIDAPAGGQGDMLESGIFSVIVSDQVKFIDDQRNPVRMEQVPALVFTEVMRDVDLFVAVCSIGADPGWLDQGNRAAGYDEYWRTYSFGELSESAKTRGDVLRGLLPKLKIGPQCELNDRFLIVRGSLRTYKIHLGSGNILMEPNNQYLCIVQGRGQSMAKEPIGRVFLPFEGDSTMSLILSKAMLLADDRKITDPTILRQIRT